jgi:hypothetical protein
VDYGQFCHALDQCARDAAEGASVKGPPSRQDKALHELLQRLARETAQRIDTVRYFCSRRWPGAAL